MDTDGNALPDSVSQSQTSPVLNAPSATPPTQLPPSQILPLSNETAVTFPSTCSAASSFSSSFISQGVDLTTFTGGDVATSNFGNQMAHRCVKCNNSFSSSYELAMHWHEEHRENFKCKRCERTFAKKHNLLRHNCVNACNICGQQFTRRYNLKLHMQVHGDGSKMHKCEYCGKSFTRRYTLLTHTRSHSGIKLFKCSICGKAFTRQHTLNLHMKRHVTKSSFYCRKCYAMFTDAVSLQLHRETEHPKAPKQPDSQGSATSQPIPPSSNVVFPNSNPGYMYGTENVGLDPSYHNHMGSYYHQAPQDVANQFQNTYHGNRRSSHTNPEEKGFDDRRGKNVMPETSGHARSLEKPNWFEDDTAVFSGRGASSRQLNPLNSSSTSGAEVVTVLDSSDEVTPEDPLYPNQSVDGGEQRVEPESADCKGMVVQDKESVDVDKIESQDVEGETRRSLFPMDNSKRHKRSVRPMNRPVHSIWKHGDKLVKETSEIRIDVIDPNSLEEMNSLLTPPRSSDTSTSRPTHASSESGSPSTASLLESPSYSTQPYPASLKIASSISPGDKLCLPMQITPQVSSNEVTDQGSICAPLSHGRGSNTVCYRRTSANGNSDSSSSSSHQARRKTTKRSNETQSEGTNWRCLHCGITFEESLMYVVHMGCHGQLDPFQCSMCGLLCQDRMAFTLHIIGGKHIKANM